MLKENNTKKVLVGFILSMLGVFSFLLPYVGIVLSILGVVSCKTKNNEEKTSLSVAGYSIGIFGIVWYTFVYARIFWYFFPFLSCFNSYFFVFSTSILINIFIVIKLLFHKVKYYLNISSMWNFNVISIT
jgi:hypothetical protein